MGTLFFLYTCRQIYSEAHLLAYKIMYSVTNRWHRGDLLDMYAHFKLQPTFATFPLKKLDFASEWRQAHQVGEYKAIFLDSMSDYATFVWDVVNIFSQLERLVIHTDRRPDVFAFTLHQVMYLDSDGRVRDTTKPHPEAEVWSVAYSNGAELQLTGKLGCLGALGRVVVVSIEPIKNKSLDLFPLSQVPMDRKHIFTFVPRMWASQLQSLLQVLQ